MKKRIKKSELQHLFMIAKSQIYNLENRTDFARHNSDEEDFFIVDVSALEDAMISAFEFGKATAEKEAAKKAAAVAKAE